MYSKLLKRVQRHRRISVLFQNTTRPFDVPVHESHQTQQYSGVQRRVSPAVVVLPSSPAVTAQQLLPQNLSQPILTQSAPQMPLQSGLQPLPQPPISSSTPTVPPVAAIPPPALAPAQTTTSPAPAPTPTPQIVPSPRSRRRTASEMSSREAAALLSLLDREAQKQGIVRGQNDSFRLDKKGKDTGSFRTSQKRKPKRRVVSKEELAQLTPRKPRPDRRSGVVYLSEEQKHGLEEVHVPEPQKIPVTDEDVAFSSTVAEETTAAPFVPSDELDAVEALSEGATPDHIDDIIAEHEPVSEPEPIDQSDYAGQSADTAVSQTAVEPPVPTLFESNVISANPVLAPSIDDEEGNLAKALESGLRRNEPSSPLSQPTAGESIDTNEALASSAPSHSGLLPKDDIDMPLTTSTPVVQPLSPPMADHIAPTLPQPISTDLPLSKNTDFGLSPTATAYPEQSHQTGVAKGNEIESPPVGREQPVAVSPTADTPPTPTAVEPSVLPPVLDSQRSTESAPQAGPTNRGAETAVWPLSVPPRSKSVQSTPSPIAPDQTEPAQRVDRKSSLEPTLPILTPNVEPVTPESVIDLPSIASTPPEPATSALVPPTPIPSPPVDISTAPVIDSQPVSVDRTEPSAVAQVFEPEQPLAPSPPVDTSMTPVIDSQPVSVDRTEPSAVPQVFEPEQPSISLPSEPPAVTPISHVPPVSVDAAMSPVQAELSTVSEPTPALATPFDVGLDEDQVTSVVAESAVDTFGTDIAIPQVIAMQEAPDVASSRLTEMVSPQTGNDMPAALHTEHPPDLRLNRPNSSDQIDSVASPEVKVSPAVEGNEGGVNPIGAKASLARQSHPSVNRQEVSAERPVSSPSSPISHPLPTSPVEPYVPIRPIQIQKRNPETEPIPSPLPSEPPPPATATTQMDDVVEPVRSPQPDDLGLIQPVSLEQAWPVEQQVDEPIEPDSVIQPKDYVDPVYNPLPMRERNESSDKNVQDILQKIDSGKSTDSKIEIVTPKRPRPNFARRRPTPEPVQPKNDLVQNKMSTDRSSGEALNSSLPLSMPESTSETVPAPMVDTPIGDLPADLWSYIGEEPSITAVQTPSNVEPTVESPIPPPLMNPIRDRPPHSGQDSVRPLATAVSNQPQIDLSSASTALQNNSIPLSAPVAHSASTVDTPIGPLPSSLWTSIGQEPPKSPELGIDSQQSIVGSDVALAPTVQDRSEQTPSTAPDVLSPSLSDMSPLIQPTVDPIMPMVTAVASPTTDWRPSNQPLVVSTPAPSFSPTVSSSIPSDTLVIQRTPADYLTSTTPLATPDKPIVVTETSSSAETAVQRKGADPTLDISHVLPPRTIQRKSAEGDLGPKESATSEAALPPLDVDELARQVYDELKRRIARDWERGRRRYL